MKKEKTILKEKNLKEILELDGFWDLMKKVNKSNFLKNSVRSKKGWVTRKKNQKMKLLENKKMDDLNKILNWYKDMNDKNECYYEDYGEWWNVREEYDCLSFEEIITECIGMRKDIQKIKELIIC
tara:strand:+ start:433 stop:807 length:375 start_codon:yes stop_codon:yes gene_type:complete